jgi:hypothetical protein
MFSFHLATFLDAFDSFDSSSITWALVEWIGALFQRFLGFLVGLWIFRLS